MNCFINNLQQHFIHFQKHTVHKNIDFKNQNNEILINSDFLIAQIMNFLIDDSQNKLILQVFNSIERSLDSTFKLGKKTEDELFDQFFGGVEVQDKKTFQVSCKSSKGLTDYQDEQVEQYVKICRPSPIKQEPIEKSPTSDLLKNSKTLSNIHLRHVINSFLKSQCQKIELSANNYSCDEVKNLTRNLLLNFFLRYTLIFEELQTMGSSQTIKKQIKKSLTTIFKDIFFIVFKKGFRQYLTMLKMIVRIWNIGSYIQNDTFLMMKREMKLLLGINIEFLLPENDKLTYQLTFKLRGMPFQQSFNYEKEKQRKKQQRLKKKKQRLKKKVLMQLKYQQMKTQNKNIKLQNELPRKIHENQTKQQKQLTLSERFSQKIQRKNVKEISTQKIQRMPLQNQNFKTKQQPKSQLKTQNIQSLIIDLEDSGKQIYQVKPIKFNNQKSNTYEKIPLQHQKVANKNCHKVDLTSNDQKFIDKLRKKFKADNSLQKNGIF